MRAHTSRPSLQTRPSPALADLLFDKAGVALCLVASDGIVLRANAEWLRATGRPVLQVVGKGIVELFPESCHGALATARAGHHVDVPRHARRVDGRETWWEATIDPVSLDGEPGLLVTARETAPEPVSPFADGRLAAEVLERGDGLFVLDAEYRFVLVNEKFERAANLSRQEVLGRVFWDVFPLAADPQSEFFQQYRRAMRDRVTARFEERYASRGTWNEITVYPTRAGGIAVFFRDVTERKRAQGDLAHEKEKYRSLFQHSVDAVYLTERDGTIRDANPAACRMHGMTLDELRQANRAGLVVNDERHAAALKARAATGQVRAEMTVRRKDGTTLPVEVESVLLDPARPDSAAFVISRDITERKRAEDALRDSAQRLRAAHERLRIHVESTPLGLVEWDSEYRVVGYSERAQEMFGWSAGEVVGKHIDEIPWVPEEDWPSVRAVMNGMASGERATNVNANRNVRKDGGVIYCEWYNSAIHDETGRLVSVLSLVLDVTARHEAERLLLQSNQLLQSTTATLRDANERLREADRLKDEFLAMLSHELRNPLAPIRNSTYVLRHAQPGSDQARRAQAVIERQADHLTRLVDDLLDVTRIARGKVELRRERMDLVEVVRRAAEDQRPLVAERGLALHLDLPVHPLWLDADPTRIAQVAGNLLHNASKFTAPGGEITVTVRARGSSATLTVRDNGVGIEPELLARVFEPFVQSDRSLARTQGGLGLGLALVAGLVELHGGTARASSAGVGQGAEFEVELPLAEGRPGT